MKRVATGWETELTVAVDSALSGSTVMELVEAFYTMAPTTRLRLREETLSGTLDALVSGRADLAIGVVLDTGTAVGVQSHVIGELAFVFAVAPHHPLAPGSQPLRDEDLLQHRAIAVADTVPRGNGLTVGVLSGQDVLTVPTMRAKLDAQLRGLGGGFLPEPLARPYLDSGRLVERAVQRPGRTVQMRYAWRTLGPGSPGRALQWWLDQLERPATRKALLERHRTA